MATEAAEVIAATKAAQNRSPLPSLPGALMMALGAALIYAAWKDILPGKPTDQLTQQRSNSSPSAIKSLPPGYLPGGSPSTFGPGAQPSGGIPIPPPIPGSITDMNK